MVEHNLAKVGVASSSLVSRSIFFEVINRMPTSLNECESYFIDDLQNTINPKFCIDVGIGYGKTGQIIRQTHPDCHITGFEIFSKYLADAKDDLDSWYDTIISEDFYQWIQNNVDWSVDLIVFGDVLEHFFKSKVYDILDMCKHRTRWIAIKTPIKYLQNSYDNNIHEAHISTISLNDLVSYDLVHYVKKDSIAYYLIRGLVS